jgi:hypothetical protein
MCIIQGFMSLITKSFVRLLSFDFDLLEILLFGEAAI